MAASGLRSKPKLTNVERLKERLDNSKALRDYFASNLDQHHVAHLTRPVLDHHADIRKLYHEYGEWAQHMYDAGKSSIQPEPLEITLGTPLPSLAYAKGFIFYLALTYPGRHDSSSVSLATLKGLMHTFISLWPRYANAHPSKFFQNQLDAYLNSEDFNEAFKLPTEVRSIKAVEPECLPVIMDTVYSSTNIFESNRMRMQMAFLTLFSSASPARPNSIVIPTCYVSSNEALKWGDLTFYLMPDDQDPNHPYLVVHFRINLLKGYQIISQDLMSTLGLKKNQRLTCLLLPLLVLAFEDNIFRHVHSIEDILCPTYCPKTRVELRLRDESKNLLICRQDKQEGVSNSRAMPYSLFLLYLKKLSFASGFQKPIIPYDSQGDRADTKLEETTSRTSILHDPKLRVFYYISQGITADPNRRDQNQNPVGPLGRTIAASAGQDPDAPTRLSIQQRDELLLQPELLQLSKERTEALSKIKSLVSGEELYDNIKDQIAALRQVASKAYLDHAFLYNRKERVLIGESRQKFFDEAAVRGMNLGQSSVPVSLKATNSNLEQTTNSSSKSSIRLVQTFDSGHPVEDYCVVINAILVQPAQLLNNKFYPGEGPEEGNKCGYCCTDLSRLRSCQPGEHVHRCTRLAEQKRITAELEATFSSQHCQYGNCNETFANRSDFITHMDSAHIKHLERKAREGTAPCCWKLHSGLACGEENVDDWVKHFAHAHNLHLFHLVPIEYCVICGIWISDTVGDGEIFETHNLTHYDDLFDQFSLRPSKDIEVSLEPIGIVEGEGYIEYTPGTGFEGRLPDFHGHIADGIALSPAFCPWCVFDEEYSMTQRVKQFTDTSMYIRHMQEVHLENLAVTDNLCPVPSCGHHLFTNDDLLIHMIKFHRVPAASSGHHRLVERLLLPTVKSVPTKRTLDEAALSSQDEYSEDQDSQKAKGTEK